MALRTRKRKARSSQPGPTTGTITGTRRSYQKSKQVDDGIPEIFKEMLSEEVRDAHIPSGQETRPLKRRRIAEHAPSSVKSRSAGGEFSNGTAQSQQPGHNDSPVLARHQTITDDSESSESEFEWEEVGLQPNNVSSPVDEDVDHPDEQLNIVIDLKETTSKRARTMKKQPLTSAEKSMRVVIHKMHVLYLLYNGFYRNSWCNDRRTQAILKKLVPPKIITLLNPNPAASQSQRNTWFRAGLDQICDLWYLKFTITSVGISRPKWIVNKDEIGKFKLSALSEKPVDQVDFRTAAETLEGSADVGAQLFCCLLRAIGVDARLVCSLQPLGLKAAAETPSRPAPISEKITLYAASTDEEVESNRKEKAPSAQLSATNVHGDTTATTPRRIKRFGQSRSRDITATPDPSKPPPGLSRHRPEKVLRPRHPVFWVETFNASYQKWIAVDALATKTVGKPSRLEPALNDSTNCMTYSIAFDENGAGTDVTKRYTKSYNAKTRQLRIDSTPGGIEWYKKAMRPLRGRVSMDRDQLEASELAAREASEGMPANIQDFKNHPYYALERHLRQNEVIHPKQEAGRVNIGSTAVTKFETVYRRKDVHIVRSADKWFRLGRDVKAGERPLKHAQPRRGRERDASIDADAEADSAGIGQYALFQTELYIPPPVVNGRIPKNNFGNLDVYVPSMVPPGAVHIRSKEAKNAARLLHVDYADAVTGFQFKGRHGTAVIEGIVVASEYQQAIETVLEGYAYAREGMLETQRSEEALRLWRRFLVGLRVVDRLKGYEIAGPVEEEERLEDEELQRKIEEEMAQYEGGISDDLGGGFVPGRDDSVVPTSRRRYDVTDDVGDDGGFIPEEDGTANLSMQRFESFGLEHLEIVPEIQRDRKMMDAEDGGLSPDTDEMKDTESSKDVDFSNDAPKTESEDFILKTIAGQASSGRDVQPNVLHAPCGSEKGGGFLPDAIVEHHGSQVGPGKFPTKFAGEDASPIINVQPKSDAPFPEYESEASHVPTVVTVGNSAAIEDEFPLRQGDIGSGADFDDANTCDIHGQRKMGIPVQSNALQSLGSVHNSAEESLAESEPGSSGEDSMPLEDPDDEDAEPEWLL